MATSTDEYINRVSLSKLNGLQFIHLNVRSLLPKVDELRNNFLTKSMDVLCFSETWLHQNITNVTIELPGYDVLRNDRPHKRGGGTCIYIDQRLQYEKCLSNISNVEVEIQSITLLGNNNDSLKTKPIIVVVIYRPPHSNYAHAYDTIKNYLNSITNLNKKELIVVGDLNWDYLDKKGQGYKYLRDLEIEFGLEQTISIPTRCSVNKFSLIDIILTDMNNVMASGCLDVSISDHFPTYIIKKREKVIKKYELKICRSYKYYDRTIFMENRLDNF